MKIIPVIAAAVAMVTSLPLQEPSRNTYLNGEPVAFVLTPPAGKEKAVGFGPWKLGAKVSESKPHDTRLNLYIVAPGDDFQSETEAFAHFDHDRVINVAPKEMGEAEFDVYWAIALEPHLSRDFTGEAEILAAAQKRFIPGDLFEFQDAPGAGFLRDVLHIDSLAGLKPYRRKDGSLPVVLIVPAGFAVRGAIRP